MDAQAWIQAGLEHAKNEKWEAASAAYQEALALAPDNAQAHFGLGEACHWLAKQDEAEKHYRRALELDPDMAPALCNLGQLLKAQGRKEEAQAVLSRFVQLADEPRQIAQGHAWLAELAGQPFKICAQCGRFATWGDVYRQTQPQRVLCPACYAASQVQDTANWLWILPLIMLASAGFLIQAQGLYLLVNLLLFTLLIYAVIAPHELAHAGMAWLLQGRVLEIRIGVGPVVWKRTWGDVLVTLRRYPVAGFCVLGFPTRQAIRVRTFMTMAAGVSFSLLAALLAAPGLDWSRLTTSWAFREVFVIVNGLVAALNLIPRKVNVGPAQAVSDGAQLLNIAAGKLSADVLHLSYFTTASQYAWQRKAHDQALAVCRAGLAVYPASSLLKNMQAILYLEKGQYAAAAACFQELLAPFQSADTINEPGVKDANLPMVKAMLLNNTAFATLMNDPGPEALQEAFAWAQQAYLMMPWQSSVEGTWGAVLIETGRASLGLKYLSACQEAQKSERNASEQASTLAYMALGQHRLGNEAEAVALLEQAVKLDGTHYTVQKVRAALQGAPNA